MLPRSVFAVCLLLSAFGGSAAAAEENPLPNGLYAEFSTPRGTFLAQLEYQRVPMTVASFVGRAEGTIASRDRRPFFTGLRWYRVVPGFVIQTGDPTYPAGGVPNNKLPTKAQEAAAHPFPFPDEIVPGLHHDAAGVLSMANAGPDTNSSEFFVTLRETNRLNYLHTVFGHVVRGLAVLPQIRLDDPVSIHIRRVGREAEAFSADEISFGAQINAAKPYPFAYQPSPATHFCDPNKLLPQEPPRERNFNFKLANFERFTGRRICARLFAKSPTDAEDAKPGAYMSALAARLGTGRNGLLVAYFADEKDWRIWLGDEAVATMLGHAPSPEDLVPEGPLHKIKMAFIEAAVAQGDAEYAAQVKAAPAGEIVPASQQLKLQMDAMLDRLIYLYEPKP